MKINLLHNAFVAAALAAAFAVRHGFGGSVLLPAVGVTLIAAVLWARGTVGALDGLIALGCLSAVVSFVGLAVFRPVLGPAAWAAFALTATLVVWLPLTTRWGHQRFGDAWARHWVGRHLPALVLPLDDGGAWRSDAPGPGLTVLALQESNRPDDLGEAPDWVGLPPLTVIYVRRPGEPEPVHVVAARDAVDRGLALSRALRTRLRPLVLRSVWFQLWMPRRWHNGELERPSRWTAPSVLLLGPDGRVLAARHGASPAHEGVAVGPLLRDWLEGQAVGESRSANAASVPRVLLGS
ncbi:MAG: hypothetical protein H6706_26220 [Myxococcales bacterium]|nr:hypothetical protein [Myxococcales bacterium]